MDSLKRSNDTDTELELNVTKKRLQKLQMVVGALCDDVQKFKKSNEASNKSAVRRLNEITAHVMNLFSQHDILREGRVWDPQESQLQAGHSASRPGFFFRKWRSEGNLASKPLPAAIQPLYAVQAPLSTNLGLVGPLVHTPHNATFDYARTLKEMLKIHGRVRRPQMTIILGMWRSKAGRNGTIENLMMKVFNYLCKLLVTLEHDGSFPDKPEELIIKARELLETPWKDLMNLTTTQAFDAVMEAIPEEEWLSFARNELGISEADMIDVKSGCTPTREQLHQMELAADAWHRAYGLMN